MDFRTPNANPNCQLNTNSRLVRKSSPAILHLKTRIADLDEKIRIVESTSYFESIELMYQRRLLQNELQRLQPVQAPMPFAAPKSTTTFAPLAEPLRIENFKSESLVHPPEEADYADLQAAMFSIREVRQEIADIFTPFFSQAHLEAQAKLLLEIQHAIDMGVPQDMIRDLIEQGINFSHRSGYYNWMQLEKIDKLVLLTHEEMEKLVLTAGANTDFSNLNALYRNHCSAYFDIAALTRGFLNDAGIRDPFAKCFSGIAIQFIKDTSLDANGFFGADGKLLPWKVGEFLKGREEQIISEYLKTYEMETDSCKYFTATSISSLLRSKPREKTTAATRQAQPTAQKPASPKQHRQAETHAEKKKEGAEHVSLSGSRGAIERAGISAEAAQALLSFGFRWGKVFYRDANQNSADHIISNAARKYDGQRKDLKDALDFLKSKGIVRAFGKTAALNTKDESAVDAHFLRLFEEVKIFIDSQIKR